MEDKKNFWQSRTLWANVVALLGTFFSSELGADLGTEEVALGFTILNGALRFVTNKKIVW